MMGKLEFRRKVRSLVGQKFSLNALNGLYYAISDSDDLKKICTSYNEYTSINQLPCMKSKYKNVYQMEKYEDVLMLKDNTFLLR